MAAIADLIDMEAAALIWMAVPDSEFSQNPFLPGYPEELMSTGKAVEGLGIL